MKKTTKLLLLSFVTISAVTLCAQTPEVPQLTPEEIKNLKELAVYNSTWNVFLNIWAILGPILAIIATIIGLKTKVANWAESEITKKANEKFGVDWATVKQLVDTKKRDNLVKSKRLAIVNKQTGRRQELVSLFDKNGFTSYQFFKLEDFNTKFDHNQFDLILFDNFDGGLEENEMSQIINSNQFPYVLYTPGPASVTFFSNFKGKVKFAQNEQNIPEYISQSF